MNLETIITKHWYQKNNLLLSIVLAPLSVIFMLVSRLKRFLYINKILKSSKIKVPVVVVGNLSVGGNGKTPLTKYIYQQLELHGMHPAIILRGYKASISTATVVTNAHDAKTVGDEAYEYYTSGARVAIGSSRVDAANLLLQHDPSIDIIISDDGLQHYKLQRDYEICVIDGERFLANRCYLPVGPLREGLFRLNSVNHIVINSIVNKLPRYLSSYAGKISYQNLVVHRIINYTSGEESSLSILAGMGEIVALCGIGNPERFYNFLKFLGLNNFTQAKFADHYVYQYQDLANFHDKIIVTTAKDYVKLAKLNLPNIFVVEIESQLDSNRLIQDILTIKKDYYG